MDNVSAIELRGLAKSFGQTVALAGITHQFAVGRIHALMGKNGSGKSTLIEMLSGSVAPSSGEIWIAGQKVALNTPADARGAGIVTVHQELSLVPALSIAENIFLGRLTKKRRLGVEVVDWSSVIDVASRLLKDMGLPLDARMLVSDLTVGQRQTVEIAKAMASNPKILLLDEPTSALASREVEQLFALVRRLRDRGVTILYITHRMSELFQLCETCTVLRDGKYIGTVELARSSPDEIVSMMFGERAAHRINRPAYSPGQAILKVSGLSRAGAFEDICFDLHRGEILGVAGLLGSGRTEVLRAIFGADPYESGRIEFAGKVVSKPSPRIMRNLGLAYTPEDRRHSALVQMAPVRENLVLASLSRISVGGIVRTDRQTALVNRQISDLTIKVADVGAPVSALSGGNQQKVVVGNWLNTQPRVIFFDEPTRGIDLRAKEQIFDIVSEQARQGVACIFVSSELEEVHSIAHRIIIMRHGRIVGQVKPQDVILADLYRYCIGGAPHG